MKSDLIPSQAQSLLRLSKDKPLSIVLGAGGVRGMAHVGVLEELTAAGIRIDCVAGTSAGA